MTQSKTLLRDLDEFDDIIDQNFGNDGSVKKGVALMNRTRPEQDCKAISKGLMGHDVSDTRRIAISAGLTGITKGIAKRTTICPHCNLEGAISTMQLYHFDKCHTRNIVVGTNIVTGEQIKLCGNTEIKNAGFSYGNIIGCINGDRKSHKGYTWTREART